MEINTLGSVLKYYREKYEIIQEDLCDGICTPVVLSQIEHGKKVVDSLTAEALLGRIGKTVLQYELLLNDEDHYLWNLRENIIKADKELKHEDVRKWLAEYELHMPGNKSVHEQFYLLYSAKCELSYENTKVGCDILFKALNITKDDYKFRKIYNSTEIEIILLLYHYNYFKLDENEIENQLLVMLDYVKRIYSARLKQDIGTKILFELIAHKQKTDDYTSVIKYADEAITFLSQGRSLVNIAELHLIRANALKNLFQKSENWEQKREEFLSECLMAYYVFDVTESVKQKMEAKRLCEETIGWQIIE